MSLEELRRNLRCSFMQTHWADVEDSPHSPQGRSSASSGSCNTRSTSSTDFSTGTWSTSFSSDPDVIEDPPGVCSSYPDMCTKEKRTRSSTRSTASTEFGTGTCSTHVSHVPDVIDEPPGVRGDYPDMCQPNVCQPHDPSLTRELERRDRLTREAAYLHQVWLNNCARLIEAQHRTQDEIDQRERLMRELAHLVDISLQHNDQLGEHLWRELASELSAQETSREPSPQAAPTRAAPRIDADDFHPRRPGFAADDFHPRSHPHRRPTVDYPEEFARVSALQESAQRSSAPPNVLSSLPETRRYALPQPIQADSLLGNFQTLRDRPRRGNRRRNQRRRAAAERLRMRLVEYAEDEEITEQTPAIGAIAKTIDTVIPAMIAELPVAAVAA